MTAWEPATSVEVALRDALRAQDQDLYFRVLSRADLLLPVAAPPVPGATGAGWGTWVTGGRTHVLAFTSPAALAACLGQAAGNTRWSSYAELAGDWPDPQWWLAVNPGLPIEGYLPAWFVQQLVRGESKVPGRTLGARSRLERVEQMARVRANVGPGGREPGSRERSSATEPTAAPAADAPAAPPVVIDPRTGLPRRSAAAGTEAGPFRYGQTPPRPATAQPAPVAEQPAPADAPQQPAASAAVFWPDLAPPAAVPPPRVAAPAPPPPAAAPVPPPPAAPQVPPAAAEERVPRLAGAFRPRGTDPAAQARSFAAPRATPNRPSSEETGWLDASRDRNAVPPSDSPRVAGFFDRVAPAADRGPEPVREAPAPAPAEPLPPTPTPTPTPAPPTPPQRGVRPALGTSPEPDEPELLVNDLAVVPPFASTPAGPRPIVIDGTFVEQPLPSTAGPQWYEPLPPVVPSYVHAEPQSAETPTTSPAPAPGPATTSAWAAEPPADAAPADAAPAVEPMATSAWAAEPSVDEAPAETPAWAAESPVDVAPEVEPATAVEQTPAAPAASAGGPVLTGAGLPLPEGFSPANSVEEDLLAAVQDGSTDTFCSTLLLARVLLPLRPGSAVGALPGEDGFIWPTEELDGGPAVVVYTSVERLADHRLLTIETVPVKFVQLIRNWADQSWSFVVNPGTPIGATLPGAQVVTLAGWAAEVGLGAEADPEPAPVAVPVPAAASGYDSTDDPARPLMQKVIAPSQLGYYLERGYDRVGGFVHRTAEVAHLNTPAKLYHALGLNHPGSPFSPDATEVYVLRWRAYRPSLYRIPYGGQGEAAMRAMEGWVIERPPFRGNGFAPGEGSEVVAEFKVDSARLPHGARLLRIDADGTERGVATFDADKLLWQQEGQP